MENVLNKIRDFRKKKGYSHEYMAHELNMSQVAYSKIEKSETKLSVERLFRIAEILETPVEEFLEVPTRDYKQEIHGNDKVTAIAHQEVQNLYQDNKDKSDKIELLFEARLKDKDDLIFQLKRMLEKLA